jgi:hypothetical protein
MHDEELTQELREIEAVAALMSDTISLADIDRHQAGEVKERVARALAELAEASEIVANAVDLAA